MATVSSRPLVRDDPLRLVDRFAASAAVDEDAFMSTAEFSAWFTARQRSHAFSVRRIPFAELAGWSFVGDGGELRHQSGKFFTVEGLRVHDPAGPVTEWHQPIMNQPEIGVLGLLVKEFDGVLHFLMQAKMEPGNVNLVQLSPTVQATRSNYSRVHKGAGVKYIEYFTAPGRGPVLVDSAQSEHGTWFLGKRNRNMVVETAADVPLDDDYCWLTLGQIARLLRIDNLVNMDIRTVLSCVPLTTDTRGVHTMGEVLSWLTEARATHQLTTAPVPLAGLPDWRQDAERIFRPDERFFSVIAVEASADNREVKSWTQPIFHPHGQGVAAFLHRRIEGVPHVLAHARREAGLRENVEIGPTVQATPDNYRTPCEEMRPDFLDDVLHADPSRILFDAVLSEEGGRLFHAQSRYMIIEADDGIPIDAPPGYLWLSPYQFDALLRHPCYVNVQARTLVACLKSLR